MNNMNETDYRIFLYKKLCIVVLVIYILCLLLLRFLAGDQFTYEKTQGNCKLPTAEMGTVDLIAGNVVEQIFDPQMHIIDSVNVQLGTWNRKNVGTIIVELLDYESNQLIESKEVSVVDIVDQQLVTMVLEQPYYVHGHLLEVKLYSENGIEGSAVIPMMSSVTYGEESQLLVNGGIINGRLCFSLDGRYYRRIGTYYWHLMVLGLLVLLGCQFYVYQKLKKGKNCYLFNLVLNIKKYKFLLEQLVARDFKTKYKRSVLGVLWSFLNPMLTMSIQYFIFSNIFKQDIEYYHIYLLIGIVFFNFFSEACSRALNSILRNTSLITKVYVPKYIYPFSEVISALINMLIAIIPLLFMIFISGVKYHKAVWLALFPIICLFMFALGLGLFLAAFMVYFRDTQFLWSVITMLWMYATPIFYPISILPQEFMPIIQINPLYLYITFARTCVLQGISPGPELYMSCFITAVMMLLFGGVVFRKMQDKFVLKI